MGLAAVLAWPLNVVVLCGECGARLETGALKKARGNSSGDYQELVIAGWGNDTRLEAVIRLLRDQD